jgi:hypothetical protein
MAKVKYRFLLMFFLYHVKLFVGVLKMHWYYLKPHLIQEVGYGENLGFVVFKCRVPDPGSGAFLTPGSRIRIRFFPDPGSLTYIFESFVTIFWVKSSIIFF